MKILLVEDDRGLVSILNTLLKPYYAVDSAPNFTEAEYHITVNDYDLVLLDIGLPDGNGIELISHIRENKLNIPILVLTGTVEEEVTVQALDAGADDYICKPFRGKELLARIRALLRRNKSTTVVFSSQITIEDLTVNFASKSVIRSGKPIDLRKKELLLLEYLLRNIGRVVTRNMMLEHIWESSSDTLTNTIDVHMNGLRRKLDKPFPTRLIKTVHGIGYKIES